MKTCGKCINFDFCKEYVTKNETFDENPNGCPGFKRKPLFKWKYKKRVGAMKNLSKICVWMFISFLLLGVLVGIVSTILQFMTGNIANGFSDLLWTCINVWILSATVGVKVHERNDKK